MSNITVIGKVTDALGHAEHRSTHFDAWGRAVEVCRFEALASVEYRSHQPSHIGIDRDHASSEIGQVVYLERDPDDTITAVAIVSHLDELLISTYSKMYFSPELRYRHGGHEIEIRSIAVPIIRRRSA